MRRTRGDFDASTLAEAMRGPGMDPRQWISYGVVDASATEGGETFDPVEFDPDYGPLVNVTLQPSNIPVRCRVAIPSTGACGNGESEYSPFISGDEVLVAIPEGDESAAPAIIGKLNNAIDRFPENVAGQDPSGNKFAFQRRRTPFVQEWANTWMVRVASHGGFILLSESGAWTLRDGAGGALQMGPDIFGFTEGGRELTDPNASTPAPTPKALLQLDLTGRRFTLQVDDALFTLNSSQADNGVGGQGMLAVNGEFTLAAGGVAAQEHVATVEFVLAALETALTNIAAGGGVPAIAALAPVIAAGGAGWTFGTFAGALATGLPVAGAIPKPVIPPTGVQVTPGLGAVFFKTG